MSRSGPAPTSCLLGALINRVLSDGLHFDEYVRAYTNATNLISENYQDTEDLDGLFSGFDPDTNSYDNSTWSYQTDEAGRAVRDESLSDPRSVFQILKRHYSRYTPEMVAENCGIKPADFEYLVESVTQNSGRERTTCFAYAVGWTQHSLGAQFIRTASILQLLLGNMGRPGGGIMALRGHATIQGSTDIPTLFNLLPGYLPMPSAGVHETFDDYVAAVGTPETHKGLLGQRPQLRHQPAQGLVGRCGNEGEQLRLRLSAEDQRCPRHLSDAGAHAQRRRRRLLPAGAEPGGGIGQRADAAHGDEPPQMDGRSRLPAHRIRHLVEGRP